MGLALVRLLAVCDLTYERAVVWLHPGRKQPPAMGRPSRQAALFDRFGARVAELLAASGANEEPTAD